MKIQRGNLKLDFTMIELMVVIGIILILAALLLPSLASSKDSARATYCINNLKNISLASFQYSQEWERFCAWGSDRKTTNLMRWHGKRSTVSNTAEYDASMGPLFAYLKGQIFACPILNTAIEVSHPSIERGGGGYGYNLYLGSDAYFVDVSDSEASYEKGILTKDLKHPDTTVMFSDTAMNLDSTGNVSANLSTGKLGEYSMCVAPFTVNNMKTQTGLGYADPSMHFRHMKQCNIGWGDGHVDAELMQWTLNSGWRDKKLGFWGPKTDNSLFDPR